MGMYWGEMDRAFASLHVRWGRTANHGCFVVVNGWCWISSIDYGGGGFCKGQNKLLEFRRSRDEPWPV